MKRYTPDVPQANVAAKMEALAKAIAKRLQVFIYQTPGPGDIELKNSWEKIHEIKEIIKFSD